MNWIEQIDTVTLCIIIFMTQLGFIFSRTMNVIYTAEHNTIGAMITGATTHVTWLISIGIGAKSVMYLDIPVMICSLIGGLIGTNYAIKLKIKLNEKNNNRRKGS